MGMGLGPFALHYSAEIRYDEDDAKAAIRSMPYTLHSNLIKGRYALRVWE